MKEREINKIIVVSLCENFSKSVAYDLSQNLEMIFCDAKELLSYQLADLQAVSDQISKAYLEKEENRVLKELSSYENVIISINFDFFFKNLKLMKNKSITIYIDLPKSVVKANGNCLDSLAYGHRSEDLKELADITIDLKQPDKKTACAKILEKLGGIL